MDATRFSELKQEILRRAKEAGACKGEYGRAYGAEDMSTLCQVLKDGFWWGCRHDVITVDLIEAYKDDFAANDIWCNESVDRGFCLCDTATVRAYGNATVRASDTATVEASDTATVEASDTATVRAYGNATVRAYGNATVRAYDNATVRAYGNAYVNSYYAIECKLADNAIHRIQSTNEVRYASDDVKFIKVQNETNSQESGL